MNTLVKVDPDSLPDIPLTTFVGLCLRSGCSLDITVDSGDSNDINIDLGMNGNGFRYVSLQCDGAVRFHPTSFVKGRPVDLYSFGLPTREGEYWNDLWLIGLVQQVVTTEGKLVVEYDAVAGKVAATLQVGEQTFVAEIPIEEANEVFELGV